MLRDGEHVGPESLAAPSAHMGVYRDSSGRSHSRKLAIQTLPGAFLCCRRSADAPRRAHPRAKLDEVTSAGGVPRTAAEKGPSNPST